MFFLLGFEHILSLSSFDHILFLLVLCGIYTFRQWRQLLILITAFTMGHCTSLVLAYYWAYSPPELLIEILIPCTIIITAVENLYVSHLNIVLRYAGTLVFGLIHGWGFSLYLNQILEKEEIVSALLAFNIGIEVAQIIVVATIVSMHALVSKYYNVERFWNKILSWIGIMCSLCIIAVRLFNAV
ncbi:MAG: HupE/UreJ family protein [Bacteroidales bacterium]|jgi:hypothetical protein|nr:HupE/UreJ family protein [Bacteroidales bacterium]